MSESNRPRFNFAIDESLQGKSFVVFIFGGVGSFVPVSGGSADLLQGLNGPMIPGQIVIVARDEENLKCGVEKIIQLVRTSGNDFLKPLFKTR